MLQALLDVMLNLWFYIEVYWSAIFNIMRSRSTDAPSVTVSVL